MSGNHLFSLSTLKRLMVYAALLSSLLFLAPAVRAQETAQPVSEHSEKSARKLDEYGKLGHCDETARLDNLAIDLQNEPAAKGYLLIYLGKDDLPGWSEGIHQKAADYLVNSRGIEPQRIEVVKAGYRENRTTELWVVPEGQPAPAPTGTIEVVREKGKVFQYDEIGFNVEWTPDASPEEEQAEGSAESEAEPVTSEMKSPAVDDAAPSVEEDEEEARWRRDVEKYQLATTTRKMVWPEAEDERPYGVTLDISLWWNVEKFIGALKSEKDARACLIYYSDDEDVGPELTKELMTRARARLEEQSGLRPERIILIDGGYSPRPDVELWVVPAGASLPSPRNFKKRVEQAEAGITSEP